VHYVRVSVKAIITVEGRLLVTKNADAEGYYYLLPGGGQEHGETLVAALQRECMEEIGVQVRVGPLLYVREYIGAHHEFKAHDAHFHQVEVVFSCQLLDGQVPANGTLPDTDQIAVEWLSISDLHRYRLYPRALARVLQSADPLDCRYLGDVN
jgi:8-oxo-dGTP diphosphatase